jgi:thiamine-phosphate pyrophosphorylase
MRVGHEGLRTRGAKLAAAAEALKRASREKGGAEAPFSLAFLTDRRRIPDPEPILRALPLGAAVLYRDYDDPKRPALARRYSVICRRRGVLFLVAGDIRLALAVCADGAHMPSRMLRNAHLPSLLATEPASAVNTKENAQFAHSFRIVPLDEGPATGGGKPFVITAACHDAEGLASAAALGADLALLSPAFATKSHPGTEHFGAERFKALASASPLPVLALGGVDEWNAPLLAGKNVAGIAAIGAFVP